MNQDIKQRRRIVLFSTTGKYLRFIGYVLDGRDFHKVWSEFEEHDEKLHETL